jgi:ABC-2 type transport system ATP-binding protein
LPSEVTASSSEHPLVEVRSLTKRYGQLTALSGASFSLRRGEILGLIGPNGSGKTSLFECVAGVLPADAGTVQLEGRLLEARVRASHLFYLPDAIAPWPSQTVSWALDFAIGYFGGSAERRQLIIEQLALERFLRSRIGTLSKGERKRATLAIGLLTPQPVLMIDEPFDGLDLRQTRELATTLRTHAAGGRTLLLSVHQIADAARLCDRFVLLSAGVVCGEGNLGQLAALARHSLSSNPAQDLEEIVLALT